jgi:hypothetical protein
MPELPEVEVLRRSLEPRLVGRRIDRVDLLAPARREPIVGASAGWPAGRSSRCAAAGSTCGSIAMARRRSSSTSG